MESKKNVDHNSNSSTLNMLVKPPLEHSWGYVAKRKAWVLAHIASGSATDVMAVVTRTKDGSWVWTIKDSLFFGKEPTKKEAMEAVYYTYYPKAV